MVPFILSSRIELPSAAATRERRRKFVCLAKTSARHERTMVDLDPAVDEGGVPLARASRGTPGASAMSWAWGRARSRAAANGVMGRSCGREDEARNSRTVSRRLGHSSIAASADTYGHVAAAMQQRSAALVDETSQRRADCGHGRGYGRNQGAPPGLPRGPFVTTFEHRAARH